MRSHDAPAPGSAPRLEPLESRLLMSAPTATLEVTDITRSGDRAHSFAVEYQSDVAIDLDSLEGLEVLVTGPRNFSQNARFMAVIDTGNPLAVQAIYRIEAPGGRWDSADNGLYTIDLRADQVANEDDETNAAATLGDFTVTADDPGVGDDLSTFLGDLTGLTIITGLNNQVSSPSQLEFRITGTATRDHFIQMDFSDEESAASMTLFRQVNGKLVREKDSASVDSARNTQGADSRRINLGELHAGTYILKFNGNNPHFSLAINAPDTPSPDLAVVAVTTSTLPDVLIPGDTFNAKVKMTNLGDGKLANSVVVDLYLSTDNVFDEADVLLGSNAVRTFVAQFGYTRVFPNRNRTSLVTGQSKTVNIRAKVPSNLVEGSYFIIARADATNLTPESDEVNNALAVADPVDVAFNFGAFAGRRATLRYTDPSGTNVQLSLTGPGFGKITFNAGVPSLEFFDTADNTRVKITTSGRPKEWTIDDVIINASLGSITATSTVLDGNVTGDLGSAKFKNVTLPL